jgi:hypothetical protein
MPAAIPSFRTAALAAFLGLGAATALALPASAGGCRGEFGGCHGWGGLFRDNRDVGYGPQYVLYSSSDAFFFTPPPAYVRVRPANRPRHRFVARHRVTRRAAPDHCACR